VMPSWASMAARRLMTLSRTPPRGLSWLDMVQLRRWRLLQGGGACHWWI
jgi:hypothetical protein